MGNIRLKSLETTAPKHLSKERTIAETEKMLAEIIELQKKFYAWGEQSILVVLQGMDASGKDGAIRQVFSGISPLGIDVHSWAKPTEEEYRHDFLWRLHEKMPPKGMIGVFNRSHYEDILVPTVLGYIDKDIIHKRYEHINTFEKMLTDEGMIVIKCFLHMSKDVQLVRLAERIETEEKYWKHKPGDFDSRQQWDDYMDTYESIFEKTDTAHAPWHIIPTDDKWYKVYRITKLLLDTLNSLPMKWPALQNPHAVYSHDKDKTSLKEMKDEKKKEPKDESSKKVLKKAEKERKKALKAEEKAQKKAAKAAKKLEHKLEKAEKKAEKKDEKLRDRQEREAKKKAKKLSASSSKKPTNASKKSASPALVKKVVEKDTLPKGTFSVRKLETKSATPSAKKSPIQVIKKPSPKTNTAKVGTSRR